MSRLYTLGRAPAPTTPLFEGTADWQQAQATWINKALATTLRKPSGGWFVLGASDSITETPRQFIVDDQELVVWRDGDKLRAGPNACPHMGASLAEGRVCAGKIVCPWHGLALGNDKHGTWRPATTFDDGVLCWIRMPSEAPSPRPFLPARPKKFVAAVMTKEGSCEPEDVIANRLDPWHGVHFHPHSFSRLKVIEQTDDSITVRVVFRLLRSIGIEVDARFDCPDPRTIVMTIVDGEGTGSVVETHATPIQRGRCAVIEATLATSERPGFRLALVGQRALRPLIVGAASRLWQEDLAYAERRYALRNQQR